MCLLFKLVWPYSEKKKSDDDGQAGGCRTLIRKKRKEKLPKVYKRRARARWHACDRRRYETRPGFYKGMKWMVE